MPCSTSRWSAAFRTGRLVESGGIHRAQRDVRAKCRSRLGDGQPKIGAPVERVIEMTDRLEAKSAQILADADHRAAQILGGLDLERPCGTVPADPSAPVPAREAVVDVALAHGAQGTVVVLLE